MYIIDVLCQLCQSCVSLMSTLSYMSVLCQSYVNFCHHCGINYISTASRVSIRFIGYVPSVNMCHQICYQCQYAPSTMSPMSICHQLLLPVSICVISCVTGVNVSSTVSPVSRCVINCHQLYNQCQYVSSTLSTISMCHQYVSTLCQQVQM